MRLQSLFPGPLLGGPLLSPARPDEDAFGAYVQRLLPWHGRAIAIVVIAMLLLFWPTDPYFLPEAPRSVSAFAQLRLLNVLLAGALFLLLTWTPLRRHALAACSIFGMAGCWLLGTTFGRLGGLDRPWFHFAYMTSLMSSVLPLRPLPRVAATAGLNLALCAGFFAARPGELRSPFLPASLGFLVFSSLVSIGYGHVLFVLNRGSFFHQRDLEKSAAALRDYGDHLEERVADQTRELRRLASHLEQTREEERVRIARELHDELGQEVSALRLGVGLALRRYAREPGAILRNLEELQELALRIGTTTRHIVSQLRPRVLDDLGLIPAVEWLITETARRGGPRCELTLAGDPAPPADPTLCTAVFRILQESLTNALRHAGARAVHVTLDLGTEAILLTVRDDGVGLGQAGEGGMGLLGMRERARALGGQLTIESAAGAGTTVRLRLPVAAGAGS